MNLYRTKKLIVFIAACALLFSLSGCRTQNVEPAQLETSISCTYEIEVDGKKYMSDSLDELSEMVGFDVHSLFEETKEKKTIVEDKTYQKDEFATIETENGTYKLGITSAKIIQRTSGQGGETLYQITYVTENIDFDSGDKSGVNIYPDRLEITDADGNNCIAPNCGYSNESENEYEPVSAGKRIVKKAVYVVKNPESPFVSIYFKSRGVSFQIEIDNVDEFVEKHKEKTLTIGDTYYISNVLGDASVTVEDIVIDNSMAYELNENSNLLVFYLDIDNLCYTGSGNDGLDVWTLYENTIVKDDEGYGLQQCMTVDVSKLGRYSSYNTVKPDTKGKIALTYEVPKTCQSIYIDFGNNTTMELPLSTSENDNKACVVEETYNAITNLTKEDLDGKEGSWSYNGIPLLSDDCDSIDAAWNRQGVVSQGVIYRKIAKVLHGSDFKGKRFLYSYKDFSPVLLGFVPNSLDEYIELAEPLCDLFVEDEQLKCIMKQLEKISSVSGQFDYDYKRFGQYSITISDCTACACELNISEESLGYVLGMLDEYGPTIAFHGNECIIEYTSFE